MNNYLDLTHIMSRVCFIYYQIHWNRGWGASGSMGKRDGSSQVSISLEDVPLFDRPCDSRGESTVMAIVASLLKVSQFYHVIILQLDCILIFFINSRFSL